LVRDWQEDLVGLKLHGVARREVLAGLLIVLLVEAPYQLLEDVGSDATDLSNSAQSRYSA
jgi:hypothetical protein